MGAGEEALAAARDPARPHLGHLGKVLRLSPRGHVRFGKMAVVRWWGAVRGLEKATAESCWLRGGCTAREEGHFLGEGSAGSEGDVRSTLGL